MAVNLSLLILVALVVAIPALLAVPASIVVFLAARKMARLESYGFCLFASILTVLPFHVAFILTLPIGVWCLATLQRPEVKRAFAGQRGLLEA